MTNETTQQSGRIDFRRYGKIIYKRRWTIATFFIIVVTLITIATFVQTPIYKATAIIQIEPSTPDVVPFKDVVKLGSQNYWASKEYYQTQFWIIRSEPLTQKVVDDLNLTETDPVFAGNPNPASTVSNMIQVNPLKNSQLVAISIEHPDPKQAAAICNSLCMNYVQYNIDFKVDASDKVLRWLDDKGSSNETELKQAQMELLDFMKENDIVSFEDKQNIIMQRLQDLSQALTEAEKSRIEKQALYEKAKSLKAQGKAEQIPTATENHLIQELKQERILLEKQYSELAEKYKPEFPKMVKLKSQIDKLNGAIYAEINNLVGSIKSAYQVASEREQKLKEAVEQAKTEAQYLNEKAIEFGVLNRRVESGTNVFSELVQRAKETQVTKTLKSNNISVRQEAIVPTSHIKPRRKTNIALSMLLGLFGGIALAFLLEYMDTTIKNQEDLELTTGLPFLGIVPSFSADAPEAHTELFTHEFPKSSITESVRSIRTNIIFSSPDKPLRKMLITSAGPQEGKSTNVINLGIIFAQGGNRVLIVDSDLRRPRLHKAFSVSRTIGLTNLIMGDEDIEDVIVQTEVPNLCLIPCGPIPPNPSELLGGERMQEIITELENRFDIVLFDSPPIVAVTDAVVLSKKVDGVVLIVKSGKTTSEMLVKAKRQLEDVSSHMLGTVLNDFNIKGEGYRYYYYYHYYRSHDDGETQKRKVRKRSSGSNKGSAA